MIRGRYRLGGRRRRLYGVGTAKSGTHSLAALFAQDLRSVHEADPADVIAQIAAVARGDRTTAQLRSFLRRRDRRLRLDVDAASYNGELIEDLAAVFPDSRFVLTIREPRQWLSSFISHSLNHVTPPHWAEFRDLRFGPLSSAVHPPEEAELSRLGLYPLDAYLAHWVRHNQRVLDHVPPDQLLVIRTEDLGPRADELANFAGWSMTLDLDRVHEFRAPNQHDVLDRLDQAHLQRRIDAHCGPLVRRWFADTDPTAPSHP